MCLPKVLKKGQLGKGSPGPLVGLILSLGASTRILNCCKMTHANCAASIYPFLKKIIQLSVNSHLLLVSFSTSNSTATFIVTISILLACSEIL